MASLLLGKETLTDRVEERLEREIRSGALPPLSRLRSVRELAADFGVSAQVVLFALDRLEAKKLLRRKERAGVFVSEQASAPGVSEALVFVFGGTPDDNPFVSHVCGVVSSEAARGRFDFFTRYVHLSYEQARSPSYARRRLDVELARLAKQFHPDAALIIGPCFDRHDVERCLELPFPLLFVGDFAEGDYPGLTYNRLGMSNDFYNAPLPWAAERGAKRVALMAASQLWDAHYFHEALGKMRELAAGLQLDIVVLPVADALCSDPERQRAGLAAAAAEFARGGAADVLVMSCLHQHPFLVERLRQEGLEPLTEKLALVSGEQEAPLPGMRYFFPRPEAIAGLHLRLCDLMDKLSMGNLLGHHEQYSFEKAVS